MARDLGRITTVKIYPPIGIARLGNSKTSFFVGPERPGERTAPAGGFKDARCAVRRQGARFRLYGFDATGALVGEVTTADAAIQWTVHVANRKADARKFDGLNPNAAFRNTDPLPGIPPIADRSHLVIDPGPRMVSGPNQNAIFDTGSFLGTPVPLGEIRTDRRGRLVVLGGFGRSGSPLGVPLATFANNDRWFDDVSDGPVTATVRFGRSRRLTAVPAWVINAPPDFAPAVESVTSLYDLLVQVSVDKGWLTAPDPPSLTRDVWPLLRRAIAIEATSMMSAGKHGAAVANAFPAITADNQAARDAVLAKVNDPSHPDDGDADMPMLWSDTYTPGKGETVTRVQFEILKRWRAGDVVEDWTGSEPVPTRRVTPDGLTRAALEACVGGPLYPGIEASWFLRDTYGYLEPFRLDPAPLKPGDVTKQMAVPWQADFTDCTQDGDLAWWPAQRPDDVYPAGSMMQMPWVREIVSSSEDMVRDWFRLGFVVEQGGKFIETERTKVCRGLAIVPVRTQLSADEVHALKPARSPLVVPRCFYVLADGFAPAELGPRLSVKATSHGRALGGISTKVTNVLLEDPTNPSSVQRITFECALVVADDSAFTWSGTADLLSAQLDASVAVDGESHTATELFQLSRGHAPFTVDGAASWASDDLRLLRIREGETFAGVRMGRGQVAPTAFIAELLGSLNAAPVRGHPFDSLPSGGDVPTAEIARETMGKPVYNFAIMRVRGAGTGNGPMSALFRLFPSLTLGTDHALDTYRRSPARTAPVPLLGLRGGELVSVPCFAAPRIDTAQVKMATQLDPANRWPHDVGVSQGTAVGRSGTASKASTFFGCWLDLNQAQPMLPRHPATPDGPFAGVRRSIQDLLRGGDVSIVAELYTSTRPVQPGTSAASTSRIAMRSASSPQVAPASGSALATAVVSFSVRATRTAFAPAADPAAPDVGDELIIDWHELPPGSEVTLYLPSSSTDEMIATARKHYETLRIERIDHHTVRLLPANVTYVPLPIARDQDQPALLTIQMPKQSARGTTYTVTISQRSTVPPQVFGTIGISVHTTTPRNMLAAVTNRLSVLRHVDQAIPTDDPWQAVSTRQLAHLADQLRQLGANPDLVLASPSGATPVR